MYLRALLAINSGKKSIGIVLLDSARRIYVSDGRFMLLYNRLVAKKNDSAAISIDSTNQMAQ
jgi:hypothetical protein